MTVLVTLTAFVVGMYVGALAMRAVWRPRYYQLLRASLRSSRGQGDPPRGG
jgi:hypothetical protein